jgi:hypothetical protein
VNCNVNFNVVLSKYIVHLLVKIKKDFDNTNIIVIIIIIIIIGIQPLGWSGQRPELSQATGMALVCCILGRFLGVVCHCFLLRLDVPTFATRCPQVRHYARDLSSRRWNCRREYCPVILPFRDLLHAANLQHGTDGFTSPPKEGVLKIFLPLKIQWLRPGLNPRTWALKASTLPLDHQSHLIPIYTS